MKKKSKNRVAQNKRSGQYIARYWSKMAYLNLSHLCLASR